VKNAASDTVAQACYRTNIRGEDDRTRTEAQRLINNIPILKQLADDGFISVDDEFNAVYAYRTKDEQRVECERYDGVPTFPSGAFKFALRPVGGIEDAPFEGTHTVWHGCIQEKNLAGIAKDGLRGYAKDGGHRFRDHTLVTPSWVIALEFYGYENVHVDGTRYRVALQVRVKRGDAIKKLRDTAHTGQRDWNVAHNEVEWAVPVSNVAVTGVVVKQYHQTASIAKLDAYNQHSHRRRQVGGAMAELRPAAPGGGGGGGRDACGAAAGGDELG